MIITLINIVVIFLINIGNFHYGLVVGGPKKGRFSVRPLSLIGWLTYG